MASSDTDRSEPYGSCSTAATPDSETSSETAAATPKNSDHDAGPQPGGARLDVDLAAIAANWLDYQSLGRAEAGAAVKADAYGCGAAAVVPALEKAGCRLFFTAALDEAVRLGPRLRSDSVIFVLNGFDPRRGWPEDPRIAPVLNTLEETWAWVRRWNGRRAAVQIETGMNRLGQNPKALAEALQEPSLGPLAQGCALLMSHLALGEAPDDPLTLAQKSAFDGALALLRGKLPQARASLAASAAPGLGPCFGYEVIRPGYGLYGGGLAPRPRPVVKLSAPLLRVWTVGEGERSGYGGAWRAASPARLATAPLGYADGVPRAIGGRAVARIRGVEAPIAGRISMDLTVLDVSALDPAPEPGERAFLLDERLTIETMAGAANTIGYEILTRLDAAQRLERAVNPF